MTHQDLEITRLAEYIAAVLPWAHGHQLKGITTFVGAIIEKQNGTQADLARGLGTQEAAVKRLSRLLHNERLAPYRLADAVRRRCGRCLPKAKCAWPATAPLKGRSICGWSRWSRGAGRCRSIGGPTR